MSTFLRICSAVVCLGLAACAGDAPPPPPSAASVAPISADNYLIGPGDTLQVTVWRNPELSTTVPVRPDGRVSTPLVEDIQAAGKTPTALAREMETRLKKFVQDPLVTIAPTAFVGPFQQQVRVVGEAAQPKALAYSDRMTVLDAMIAVGGLTPFASGNRARLIRAIEGQKGTYTLRLDDLLKDGDIDANAALAPGDVIIIPQSFF